jgi:WD40 repeat protein
MSRPVRRVLLFTLVVLVAGAFAAWAYQIFFADRVQTEPVRIELERKTFEGIAFEVEYNAFEGINLRTSSWQDVIQFVRGDEVLECDAGALFVNGNDLPDVRTGDAVRWNLSGPLLINGQPAAPHPIQTTKLDAAATPFEWTPLPSGAPRDTLSVAWVGKSRLLVAAHGDGAIRIWDADKARVVRTIVLDPPSPRPPTVGPPYLGQRAAVSPDGQSIASLFYRGKAITLSNVADGAKKAEFAEPNGKPNEVLFAANDWLLETDGDRLLARKLDAKEPIPLGTVHTQMNPALAFSPQGSRLAWNDGSAIHGGMVHFKDARAEVVPIGRTIAPVRAEGCLAFSADGNLLAVFNGTNRLALYDAKTFDRTRALHWRGTLRDEATTITALAFSPDGMTLAVGAGKTLRLYDVASGRERAWLPCEPVRSLAYSADGRTLAVGVRYAPGLAVWDTADLKAK